MKTKDVADHFGGMTEVARALKVSRQTVYAWKEDVPELWARRLHDLTDGKLLFIRSEYPWLEERNTLP